MKAKTAFETKFKNEIEIRVANPRARLLRLVGSGRLTPAQPPEVTIPPGPQNYDSYVEVRVNGAADDYVAIAGLTHKPHDVVTHGAGFFCALTKWQVGGDVRFDMLLHRRPDTGPGGPLGASIVAAAANARIEGFASIGGVSSLNWQATGYRPFPQPFDGIASLLLFVGTRATGGKPSNFAGVVELVEYL